MIGTIVIIILIITAVLIFTNKFKGSSLESSSSNNSSVATRKINVSFPHPEKSNDYRFYKFVETTSDIILKPLLPEIKKQGMYLKPEFEAAIQQKIDTGKFENPIDFKEYYGTNFDFIAIDFETANNERISACAIGLAFIKDKKLVGDDYFYIKPPKGVNFLQSHINIHGITKDDVEYWDSFDILWQRELKDYLNNNLVLLHNASMDASILKQLFSYYQILNCNIRYVCTMKIAKQFGYPAKLKDLCILFNIDFENQHDPAYDAIACAEVGMNYIEKGINIELYSKYISTSATSL